MARRAWLAIILAPLAYCAAPKKPFIDSTREELVRAVPDLADLQFDVNQDGLEPLLRSAGKILENSLGNLVNISAAEQINELRFDQNMSAVARLETFRYEIRLNPAGPENLFQEVRLDTSTNSTVRPATSQFLVLSYFYKLLNYLRPQYRDESQFRYLGRLDSGAQHYFIVAFSQHSDSALASHLAVAPNRTALLEGIAWIDAATNQIVRLRVDLLGTIDKFPFESVSTDILLSAVGFKSAKGPIVLPMRVTTDASFTSGQFHSVHRYAGYRAAEEDVSSVAASNDEDAYETLVKGIAALKNNDTNAAIAEFRASLRLNSSIPATHFNLAQALFGSGDLGGAETELRQAVKLVPESVLIHNLLGVVLGKRGDTAGAVAEFRACAQITPKEPNVHFNLAESLESTGDRAAALAEYRIASELAPGNGAFKSRYEQFERGSPASTIPGTTIKVDVSQIQVPVVVTDRDGHNVTGLTRDDFRVFEDGVEQKITAFSVEDSGLAGDPPAPQANARSERSARAPVLLRKPEIRQTYVICIDTLHSAAHNLMSFRESLLKFFRTERAADSQYILVAMGTSLELLQDTTSDPEKILKVIEGKQFQKVFLDSRKAAGNFDLAAFRDTLQRVRAACDSGDPACIDKMFLPAEARELASEDRIFNMSYFDQFKTLVERLKDAPGRRSIVLISDGFPIVPGKEPLDLLIAYFPEFRSLMPEALDRMQELDPVLRLAANNNIPIYTIDSRGLYPSPFFDASSKGPRRNKVAEVMTTLDNVSLEAGNTLAEIADVTGGTAFRNNNNLVRGLQLAFADGRQYYMLSYASSNASTDGKFRHISVKVRDPKMSVKAKRGYWAASN
jgi:VWFA-related protein